MYFCAGSFENAMSHTEPSPRVFGLMIFSFTNLPSFLNTWMRSFGAVADVDESVVASARRSAPGCGTAARAARRDCRGPRLESDGTWP